VVCVKPELVTRKNPRAHRCQHKRPARNLLRDTVSLSTVCEVTPRIKRRPIINCRPVSSRRNGDPYHKFMSALLSRDDLCWVPNAFLRLFAEIVSLALGAGRFTGLEPRCEWMSKNVGLGFLFVGFPGVVGNKLEVW